MLAKRISYFTCEFISMISNVFKTVAYKKDWIKSSIINIILLLLLLTIRIPYSTFEFIAMINNVFKTIAYKKDWIKSSIINIIIVTTDVVVLALYSD